ncbi:MAG: hypothetical protein IT423_06060 [Pirellulaceae bacterium]|nr:hypothetical protein [Pirellulaceae bacterium]
MRFNRFANVLFRRSFGIGLVIALATGWLTGCGSRPENLESASGIVTLDGQPVAEANVMFHPTEGGPRPSYGTTNERGEFQTSTFGLNDGALVGHHQVTVVKFDANKVQLNSPDLAKSGYSGQGYEAMMGPTAVKNREKSKHLVPEKYGKKETSGLTAVIKKGQSNHIEIELRSVPSAADE